MKRLLTTLRDKWPEYLLEIIVLVIGIYGAFELDRWNENRRASRAEKEQLINVYEALRTDSAHFLLKPIGRTSK